MVEFKDRREEETIPGGRRGEHIPVAEYKKHYNRGWMSSSKSSDGLDRADARGEPNAWYDGYMDVAVGRPKWKTLEARRNGVEPDELD